MTDVPDLPRRQLLRTGGLTLTFAALVSACSRGDDEAAPTTSSTPQRRTEEQTRVASDLALLNTALSLEVLAFDTYQVAVDGGLLERREVVEALELFQQHHAEHRDALVAVVEGEDGKPFTTANPVAKVILVNPAISTMTSERDFVRVARDLEQICAQLAVHAASELETAELRSTVMGIGAVASRRATYLDLLGDLGSERPARFPTANPLPPDAVVPD